MITTNNTYWIIIPGEDATPRVRAIIGALRADGIPCVGGDGGNIVISCQDDKFQKRWLRRLNSASRDDLLENGTDE